jgi:hypothetical protein
MLDVHKGGGRRAGCVVVKEMTVSSASGVESVGVRNRCFVDLEFDTKSRKSNLAK